MKNIVIGILWAGLCGSVAAAQLDYPEREGRFLERAEEGWFWYEEIPEEETPPEPPEQATPQSPVETLSTPKKAQPESKPAPPAPTGQAPAPMSAEWFRQNISKYKDMAWENPTPENISAFLYVQKMALNRSAQFAEVWQQVVATDPMLDANSTAPTTTSPTLRLRAETKKARKELLTRIKEQVGLIYFFNGSQYSQEQARTINNIQKLYGIEVLAVSTDGTRLPDDFLAKVVMDEGQSKVMGVRQVPATFVAFNDNTTKPIGVGMFARPLLEDRILLVSQMHGAISDEEYLASQFQLKREEDLIAAVAPVAMSESETNDVQNTDGFIPPKELLRIIKQETSK